MGLYRKRETTGQAPTVTPSKRLSRFDIAVGNG